MMIVSKNSIVTRYEKNPILAPKDMPVACCAVYNSGVAKTNNGEYIMVSRFESPNKDHYVWVSRSSDGINFIPDPEPVNFIAKPQDEQEYNEVVRKKAKAELGTWYDPRINPVDGKYYITYAVAGSMCRIAIGITEDFRTIEHISFPLHTNNRNAVLFPEKIGGEFWMLHRPQSFNGSGSMWIASSPDLKYWGNCRVIASSESFWESIKIGPAAPPIKTSAGWLEIYHGVFGHSNGVNYGAGALLLDLKEPWKVIARAKNPIMFVEEIYEMAGQVPNVIFPGAIIPEPDNTVKIYYGAADYVQCLAVARLDDLIDTCFNR